MTVWQNLQAILETISPSIPRAERHRRAHHLLDQYGLLKCRDQKADTLSGGERRKLEISRTLVTDPKLILLDEPFSGVDPKAVEDLQQEVRRLKHDFGKSVLITDHNVAQTLKVCDRAIIIADGRVMAEGTPREVINNEHVKQAYTGNLFRGDEFDDMEAYHADVLRGTHRVSPTRPRSADPGLAAALGTVAPNGQMHSNIRRNLPLDALQFPVNLVRTREHDCPRRLTH